MTAQGQASCLHTPVWGVEGFLTPTSTVRPLLHLTNLIRFLFITLSSFLLVFLV